MSPLSDADKAGLLRAAALLIESRQPAKQATMSHRAPPAFYPVLYLVRFDFPGVVRVYAHDTGTLIVQSQAGRPTEPEFTRAQRAGKPSL